MRGGVGMSMVGALGWAGLGWVGWEDLILYTGYIRLHRVLSQMRMLRIFNLNVES